MKWEFSRYGLTLNVLLLISGLTFSNRLFAQEFQIPTDTIPTDSLTQDSIIVEPAKPFPYEIGFYATLGIEQVPQYEDRGFTPNFRFWDWFFEGWSVGIGFTKLQQRTKNTPLFPRKLISNLNISVVF